MNYTYIIPIQCIYVISKVDAQKDASGQLPIKVLQMVLIWFAAFYPITVNLNCYHNFSRQKGLHSSLMTFKTIPLVPHCN